MTTHLGARAVQAGALLALVGGMLAVASSPAQAIAPAVQITSVSSTNIASGERTTVKYTVTNPNPPVPGAGQVRIEVSGMSCRGDCSPAVNIGTNETREFSAELTGPNVNPGSTRQVRIQVKATVGNDSNTDTNTVTVRGPDRPQQVRQISGRVRDEDGKTISGAQVVMQDSSDHQYETTSNGDGGYSFSSSDDRPITPGAVSVGAGKNGFTAAAVTVQAAAGKTVNVPLVLKAIAAATPSATPTATDAASAEPLDEESVAAADPATAGADTETAATSSDSGSGSLLFIILGGLLVAAGVGAIVLVLMRRRNNGDDEDDFGGPDGVVPPSQGGYNDATRVAAPVGGRPNDATMVAGMPGAASMSDAPTMLQRPIPVDEEFPDPYGAPARPQAVYGGTYGGGAQMPAAVPTQAGGYDDGYAGPPTQYGRPVADDDQYAGYGQQGGYGGGAPQQRYDEPTGMYRPEPEYDQGGYRAPTPDYPAPAGRSRPEPTGAGYPGGGYDQGGYQSYGGPGGGVDGGKAYGPASGGGGYGAAPAGGGAYGPPAGGGGGYDHGGTYGAGGGYGGDQGYQPGAGYEDQGGYGGQGGYSGGYDQRGGYDQGYDQRGGGYGGQGAGYDQGYDQGGYDDQGQPGGRHGGQSRPPESTRPGQRRPVNWMDD